MFIITIMNINVGTVVGYFTVNFALVFTQSIIQYKPNGGIQLWYYTDCGFTIS